MSVYNCKSTTPSWVPPNAPALNVNYDVRNPPAATTIATYVYTGPSLVICGNPTFSVRNSDGASLLFLTATFNSVSGIITITLPNNSTAVKGNYTLLAVFTQPDSYNLDLGLNLKVYDICDSSYFE